MIEKPREMTQNGMREGGRSLGNGDKRARSLRDKTVGKAALGGCMA